MNKGWFASCAAMLRSDSFFYGWLAAYGAGTAGGILAARVSCAAMGQALLALCGSVCPHGRLAVWPLCFSAALFFLVIVLLAQLPGGRFLTALLTCGKAFCTAYVFGVFYVFQQQADLRAAIPSLAVHILLLLPALYALSCLCRRTGGLRAALPPLGLALCWLLLAAWLETLLFPRL